jgi:hypothetical protein
MSSAIQGQCLCGQTTITIENGDSFKDQIVCHCWDCKQTSGSAFSTNVLAPVKDTKIEGPIKEYSVKVLSGNTGKRKSLSINGSFTDVAWYNPVTRVFCANCGSAISHRSAAFGEGAAVQTGNFKYFAEKPVGLECK